MAKKNQTYKRTTNLAIGFNDYETIKKIKKLEEDRQQYLRDLGASIDWGWFSSASYAEMFVYSISTIELLDEIIFGNKTSKNTIKVDNDDDDDVAENEPQIEAKIAFENEFNTTEVETGKDECFEPISNSEENSEKVSKKKSKKKSSSDSKIISDDLINIEDVKEEETLTDVLKRFDEEERPTINLSEIYEVEKKQKEFILLDDIFEIGFCMFMKLVDEITEMDSIPVFVLFESDLIALDSMKETNDLARHLIKFFAQDDNNMFSRLVSGVKPEGDNLIKYCSENNITPVTGDAVFVLKAKLSKNKVLIPKCIKDIFQNPCQGSNVYGFDTCATFVNNDILKDVLKDAKSILLSDIQLEQIGDVKSYILKVCAYYGKILPAKKNTKGANNSDRDIVQFYKTNPVDKVITCDFGFKMFAKFAGVNCSILSTEYSTYTISEILTRINSASSRGFKEKEISQCNIVYDFLMNSFDGKLRIFTDSLENIAVYNSSYHKRTLGKKYTEVKKGEFVIIRENGKILVTIVNSIQYATGKVLYFGSEDEMPNCYHVFK